MKNIILALLVIFIASFLVSCTSRCDIRRPNTPAKVLIVNDRILEGRMIGAFLGSASGYISNDVIKVGVEIKIQGVLILVDLRLSHAELVYYKDVDIIPVDIMYSIHWERLRIWLHGREIYRGNHKLTLK